MGDLGPTTSEADQAHASELRAAGAKGGEGSTSSEAIDHFAECDVASGTFKYVQVHAMAPDGRTKVIVRSAPGSYHADVADDLCEALSRKGLQYKIPGGGRIRRDDAAKEIEIYGHSKGFGLPDHSISARICQAAFPGYKVTHRDTGY
eukprot:TRINITY_DN109770_c0_g1_i1.p1 TRINITY_DN109770_c0_g1~~TRINITY_DN109770_c0_g1_i1.p1  ORF type:complete len:156 (+),score=30.27 TRINITY_DN109770_c0_g1_i1:26-469(+)